MTIDREQSAMTASGWTAGVSPNPEHLLLPWGKWGDNANGIHPLVAHLLDVAAVVPAIICGTARTVQTTLTQTFAAGDAALALIRFQVLAAVHDLGKCEPVFQGQLWSPGRDEFAAHAGRLATAGFPMTADPSRRPSPSIGKATRLFRHEAITGHLLASYTKLPSWARLVVIGHHGRYPWSTVASGSTEVAAFRANATSAAWAALQRDILGLLSNAITPNDDWSQWPTTLPAGGKAWLPVWTGLVCLADWIASDESFVESAPLGLLADPSAYLRARIGQAQAEVPARLGQVKHPTGTFEDLFEGKHPDRPVQRWAVGTDHGPGLTVVMAPMAEGKTEAVLWIHAAGRDCGDGLLFALPTTATTDAMFIRVRTFYDGIDTFGHLAHGRAVLNAYYQESSVTPIGVDGGGQNGLHPGSWFSGRHRALTAPVTTATQDQALAAAVNHKYVPVRLTALAGKHLVLDEVHTLDPYQHLLLCRLLGWLALYRTRVTLLSATLPARRLRDYAQAWRCGWLRSEPRLLDRTPVEVLGGVYPAVVRIRDDGDPEVTAVDAYRMYQHQMVCHRVSADPAQRVRDTVTLIGQLRAAHPQARIGVVINTIDRAIDVATMLPASPPSGAPLVLHSRMTEIQRQTATKAIENAVGKEAPAGPVTVVATQAIEASLDLDFDYLISDLATMASLLQRIGRQWRHSIPRNGSWDHPAHLAYRDGDPVLHVLVPQTDAGTIPRAAALPYSLAEITKTWTEPACLDQGNRTVIRIPQDLQAAVDAADVSFADLGDEDLDESFMRALTDHLGQQAMKIEIARGIGTDATGPMLRRWREWETEDDQLAQLTEPTLWHDEAVTRLRDTDQVTFLLYDPTGANPHAWAGDPTTLLRKVPRAELLTVLAHTVPVSGSLARKLADRADHHLRAVWDKKAPPLLRGLTPVALPSIADLVALDPMLGLTRVSEGRP